MKIYASTAWESDVVKLSTTRPKRKMWDPSDHVYRDTNVQYDYVCRKALKPLAKLLPKHQSKEIVVLELSFVEKI